MSVTVTEGANWPKVEARVERPDEVMVTISATMSVAAWKYVLRDLEARSVPSQDLKVAIANAVRDLQGTCLGQRETGLAK